MVNRFFLFFFLILLLPSMASAVVVYQGQSHTWDFSSYADTIKDITFEVKGNSSDLNGLNFSIEPPYVTVYVDWLYMPDNFTITFNINGENYVSDSFSSSGGSSSSSSKKNVCYRDYTCSEWGECINGIQRRNCVKVLNKCLDNEKTYPTTKECKVLDEEKNIDNQVPVEESKEELSKKRKGISVKVLYAIVAVLLFGVVIYGIVKSISRRKEIKAFEEGLKENVEDNNGFNRSEGI